MTDTRTIRIVSPERKPRFKVGTVYQTRGKHPLTCTVTDIWTTYDNAGEFVRLRYVATHEFCGQVVEERDIVETTIARGLIKAAE